MWYVNDNYTPPPPPSYSIPKTASAPPLDSLEHSHSHSHYYYQSQEQSPSTNTSMH